MRWTRLLVALAALAAAAAGSDDEAVVERPTPAKEAAGAGPPQRSGHAGGGGADGGGGGDEGGGRGQDEDNTADGGRGGRRLDAWGRQGPADDMFSATMNALNPVPYLLGGLNGVRQVVQQRLNPLRDYMIRNPPPPYLTYGRYKPRPPHGLHGTPHRPFPGGRVAGAGGRHVGEIRDTGFGRDHVKGQHEFGSSGPQHAGGGREHESSGRPLRDAPHTTTTSQSQTNFPGLEFGPPKPNSIVAKLAPSSHATLNDREPLSFETLSITPSAPPPPSSASPPSSISKEELVRVINIKVPEEMQNLTVLEISMKTNGDVSISGGAEEDEQSPKTRSSSSLPLTSSSSSPFEPFYPPEYEEMFPADELLFGFESDPGVATNPQHFDGFQHNLHEMVALHPFSGMDAVQAVRMSSLTNTNPAFKTHSPSGLDTARLHFQPMIVGDGQLSLRPRATQLPRSFLRGGSSTLSHENSNKPIYFVPVSLSQPPVRSVSKIPTATPSRNSHRKRSPPTDSHSPVYLIDITIPGTEGEAPIVNSKMITRRKRSLQFDGWNPMDVSNPMSDDPTVGYQPPPLQRVHFVSEATNEKPMYPVRPENPTVFVVRSEPEETQLHSVYGTENVEYYHIHPQTNTVRAFRPHPDVRDPIHLVAAPQLVNPEDSMVTVQENVPSVTPGTQDPVYLGEIPTKEQGFAERYDSDPYEAPSGGVNSAGIVCDDKNQDLDVAYSEQVSVVKRRPWYLPLVRHNPSQTPNLSYRPDPPHRWTANRRQHFPTRNSRPTLYELLGNVSPRESQIESSPYLGSATDSAGASVVRKAPPPNFRYSTRRTSNQRQSRPKSVTSGVLLEDSTSSRPWFLIDTRSDPSKRKREPSFASYIFPETQTSDQKVHYKPFGPVSYISKEGETVNTGDLFNPHLDDHMNSYKPTLTANSLSELLQIFRFTQVTEGPEKATSEPTTVREFRYTRPADGFGITEPTIFPTNYRYTPSPDHFYDPVTEPGVTERPVQSNDTKVEKPTKPTDDAVADTNSLDGYLFSDSETSPEYARPKVRINTVSVNRKDETDSKGATRGDSPTGSRGTPSPGRRQGGTQGGARGGTQGGARGTSRVRLNPSDQEALEGLEIIYPGPSSSRKNLSRSPLYIIHQGHSKVRVFGINSEEEKDWDAGTFTDVYVLSTPKVSPRTTSTTVTTNSPPTTTTTTTTQSVPTTTPTTTFKSTPTTSAPSSVVTSATSKTTDVSTPSTVVSTVEQHSTATATATPTDTTPEVEYDTATPGEVTDEEAGEYLYYDYPDLVFGEDYPADRPVIRLPSPLLDPSQLALLPSGPGLLRDSPQDLNTSGFLASLLQDRLPHTQQRDASSSGPQASPPRSLDFLQPVFLTQRRSGDNTGNVQEEEESQPFEHLTAVRNIDKETLAEDDKVETTGDQETMVPRPRMKRVLGGRT